MGIINVFLQILLIIKVQLCCYIQYTILSIFYRDYTEMYVCMYIDIIIIDVSLTNKSYVYTYAFHEIYFLNHAYKYFLFEY